MVANNPEVDATATEMDENVARETGTGLDENVAGALSYLFGVLTGLVFFVVEQENAFVRFHAAQSIAVFGIIFVAAMVTSVISGIMTAVLFTGGTGTFFLFSIVSLGLSLVWLAVGLGSLVLWVYLMFSAYQGKTPRIPVAARIADRLV